jgi:sec-independent protein translocase protein TatA
MFRSIGFPELVVILLVAVVLFGGKKLADVGKGLGEGIRNFKTSMKGDENPPAGARNAEEKKQA